MSALRRRSKLFITPVAWGLDSCSLTPTFENQQFLGLPSDGLLLATSDYPRRPLRFLSSPRVSTHHEEAYFKSHLPFRSSLFCSIFFP